VNKYHRHRDTRKMEKGVETGCRLSCCIEAANGEEADAIFEERWEQRVGSDLRADRGTPGPARPEVAALPIITGESLRAQFLAPGALEIKRRTPLFTSQ